MSESKEELPSLYDFVKSHLAYNEVNQREENDKEFRLKRFWNNTKFEPTKFAKSFIKTLKENWDNDEWDENKWIEFGRTPIKEIRKIIQDLQAERIVLDEGQTIALCNGYRWALLEIVIKSYPAELNAFIESTKHSKNKKEIAANESAQKKMRAFSAAMKQIKGYILAEYTIADLEKLEEADSGEKSRVPDEISINKDDITEATLAAIASGSKGRIQEVIDTFYTDEEEEGEKEKSDVKPLLAVPKDQWEARKETLEFFKQKHAKDLASTYLFQNRDDNDPVGIKTALYGLFNYIDSISVQDKTISLGKKTKIRIGQKSGEEKKEELKAFVQLVAQSETLADMEKLIHDELKSDRKEKGSLLENRGLIGGYWIGSLFARKFNPVDGKCINSTTESYLVSLYDKVREQRKLETELAEKGDELFSAQEASFV